MSLKITQSTTMKARIHIPVFQFLRSSTIPYLYPEQNPNSIGKNYNIFFITFLVLLTMSFSISKFFKSFGHAFDGWHVGLKERNIRIHFFVTVCVISSSIFFEISAIEWLIVIFLIGAVISAELFNTAIEEICDLVTAKLKLQYSDTTIARDLSAGAVLAIATVSAIIGLIIFIPKVLILFL